MGSEQNRGAKNTRGSIAGFRLPRDRPLSHIEQLKTGGDLVQNRDLKPGTVARVDVYHDHVNVIGRDTAPKSIPIASSAALEALQGERVSEPARCVYLAELALPGATLLEITQQYADWILGVGAFERARSSRVNELGVPASMKREDLLRIGRSMDWSNACEVVIRPSDHWALIQFRHRDTHKPAVLWENRVILLARPDGVRVDHALLRSSPVANEVYRVNAPEILAELQKNRPVKEGWEASTNGKAAVLRERDVAQFHHGFLCASHFEASPCVVIAPGDGEPLVHRDVLGRGLQGFARVVELDDPKTLSRWNDELTTRQAVAAGEEGKATHRLDPLSTAMLYIPRGRIGPITIPLGELWLRAPTPEDRSQALVASLRHRYVRQMNGFASSFDARLLSQHEANLRAAATSLEAAKSQASAAAEDARVWRDLVDLSSNEVGSLQQKVEELRTALEQERERRNLLEDLQARSKAGKAAEAKLPPKTARVLLKALILALKGPWDENIAKPTATEGLILLANAYPDSLVIHPRVWGAIEKGGHELHPLGHWLEQMDKLATTFVRRWPNVTGDDAVFTTREYVRTESKEVVRDYPNGRVVDWNGRAVVCDKHLRTGDGRTHFEVVDNRGKRAILVSHAGFHLEVPGF